MDNFKSFNEFRREQHAGKLPEEKQEKINQEPLPEEPPEEIPEEPAEVHHKKKHHAIHRGKAYLAGAAGVVVLLVLALLFLPIPLGYILLTGTDRLTLSDVLFEGRISQPVNVLQISSSELEERLSHDIRVAHVTVTRHFPFELEVNVEDRVPLAVIQGEMSYAFIDKEGMVIDSVQAIRKTDVPMITGKRLGNLLLGDRISQPDIDKALDFLNHLSPEGRKAFSEVNLGNEDNIRAYTRDGVTVRLGDGSDMAQQAELAENMVGDVKARGLSVEYVDANLASPFIKLKK